MVIFMYHGFTRRPLPVGDACFIEGKKFLSQLGLIKRNFRLVPLVRAAEVLEAGDRPGGRTPAAITIDDGFQSTYDIAYPALLDAGAPATVFPVSGFVGTDDTLWYCRLHEAITRTRRNRLKWGGLIYPLSGARSRSRSSRILQEKLKRLSQNELLRAVKTISATLGIDPHAPVPETSPFRMLAGGAIREMASSDLIDFGAHTHTHPILSRIPPAEQRHEIRTSMEKISEITGRPCYTFAYPNGTPKDYTDETAHLLKCMNISVAVTTTWGPNGKDTPLTALKRCGFDARVSPAWFRVQTKLLAMPPERRALINSGLFRSPIRRLVRQWRRAEG